MAKTKGLLERLRDDVVLADGGYIIGGCCGCVGSHIREMARALGKAEDKAVWTPDASSPMSETEFNWDRRQG